MRFFVAALTGSFCLFLTASVAEARSLPEWDAAGQCKAMSIEDDVSEDPLYSACLEREEAAYQTLKAELDGIPDASWNACIEMGNLEKSYLLFLDCLEESPSGAGTLE